MFSLLILTLLSQSVQAHTISPVSSNQLSAKSETVLTNLAQAKAVGGKILAHDEATDLAVTFLSELQLNNLSKLNHSLGKCAGFETLSAMEAKHPQVLINQLKMADVKIKNLGVLKPTSLTWDASYQKLADLSDPSLLQQTVTWISSYPHRYNKAASPNQHVEDLKVKLNEWLKGANWNYEINLIAHQSTNQKTLRLTIPGKTSPDEVIVLGGHFDSINQSFFNKERAPGADDNASGSANLIESLKILKLAPQPARTLEFYWYAGEESGLLGSAEIAQEAKLKKKNVVAVLQLDMTLFPGSGEQIVGLITDYTSPWLREVLTQINNTYVKVRFVDDECGYGCSDHASWHRQGYHAVTPFEAVTSTMNRNIHTEKDIIDTKSSFKHSDSFTKFAILFALVLGNSDLRPPIN